VNNNNNLVSVIMSVYNADKTISQCLESIVNQTYTNLEVLIMDDCSSDNTAEILKNYEEKYSNIKIYKNNQNIGLTKSLNILIQNSKGFYIARHDADDVSLQNRIDKQVAYIEKFNLDGCTTRAKVMHSKKIIPSLSYYLPLKNVINYKNPFIHGSLILKMKVIKDLNLYDESFYYSQDYKLMKDLILNNYDIRILKDPLYILNMKDNISTNFKDKQQYYANCVKKGLVPEKPKGM
jgi:glycosyltransferase involved in cell wall biosynthesis|tara:strand:+ start:120 stop:827 length:708 start_codon:yes stop_codon:yes gene_type:complete